MCTLDNGLCEPEISGTASDPGILYDIDLSSSKCDSKMSNSNDATPSVSTEMKHRVDSDHGKASQPWHKRRYTRLLVMRVLIRVGMIAALVLIFRYTNIPWQSVMHSYNKWIVSLGPLTGPTAFWICATAFSSLSPTGYLPTLLAGATFDHWVAILIAYTSVNVAAVLNVVLVRKGLRPCAER